jgi:hypothetical protein
MSPSPPASPRQDLDAVDLGLSLTVTNWTVIVPVLLAVAVNGSITATHSPPAVREPTVVQWGLRSRRR